MSFFINSIGLPHLIRISRFRTLFDFPGCEHKLCITPCSKVVENADVGHATHGGKFPGAVYISSTDSSGNTGRPEYMVPYAIPIENTTSGQNINHTKTANLNNNPEALANVHINSSRQPKKPMDTGTDDITNIN